MEQEILFMIVLETPTKGVDFGLQKGSGNNYETVSKQRSEGKDLQFEFKAKVKSNKNNLPDFKGPFVQGNVDSRFVYIDIGKCAGQADSIWTRRLKIPLNGITWDMITKVAAGNSNILITRIAGTGKDGGPNCATVKPFSGWKLFSR